MQTARVWLGSLQRHCQLLPYFDGPLMVLVLLHDHVVITPDVLAPIAEVRCGIPLGPGVHTAFPYSHTLL